MATNFNCKIRQVVLSSFIHIMTVILLTSINSAYAADVRDTCTEVGINFNRQHSPDLNLMEGDDAEINCKYSFTIQGSKPLPFWRIRNHTKLYTESFWYYGFFPRNVVYDGARDSLIIKNIDISMNDTSIACCFNAINGICESNFTFVYIVIDSEAVTEIYYYHHVNETLSSVRNCGQLQVLLGYRPWFVLINWLSYILCH